MDLFEGFGTSAASMWLLIGGAVVVAVVSWLYGRVPNGMRAPGPWGLPIVGYLPWLDAKSPHETLTRLSRRYGPIYGLKLGGLYTIVLSDVKMIKRVLARDNMTGRAPLYLTHGLMKGYGLICAEGELWKNQRKFIHGCMKQFGVQKFGNKREQMESMIIEQVLDCINFIKEDMTNEHTVVISPVEILRHNIGYVINQIVFGISYERDDKTWNWLQFLQEEGVQHIGVAGPLNFLPFLIILPKFKKVFDFLLEGKKKTHKIYENIIENRIKDRKHSVVGNVLECFLDERETCKNTPEYEKFFNQEQFNHLLADIFGAGLDTTLVTLSWYFLFVASNAVVQEKLHDELDAVLGDRRATLEDLPSLPFVEATIAEAQRIRSVTPLGIPHGALEDTEIDGFAVPKGTMIVPLQWAVHMDDRAWNDPEEFKPERFLNDEGKFVKHEAWIPFQTGKRMCVGDELARMILFLFIANMMRTFRITLADDGVPNLTGVTGITLAPAAHKLRFSLR